jgi:hypothetical protein
MSANINARVTPPTHPPVNLVGVWLLNDNRWVSTTTPNYLLFIERQNPKPKKVGQYILSVNPQGVRTYVSSVYPRGGNKYKIDFQGVEYILERTTNNSLRVSIGNCPTM